MDLKKIFSRKRIIFLSIFVVIALIAQRINFSGVVGAEKQYFTLFQFFGPIAGAFLGGVFGIVSVLFAELINFVWVGQELSWINIFRLTPMLFAVYYFSRKSRKSVGVAVPIVCMALFMLHPVGRTAWFFSLYWLIPIIVKVLPNKYSDNVMLKGLGATFTAHAVGSTVWLYSIPMTAEQWIGLIPQVAYERGLFALGIAGSYVILNTVLDKLSAETRADAVEVDKDYVISKRLFRLNA